MKSLLIAFLILGTAASQVCGQLRQGDTLRVVNASCLPGDTVAVPISLVNSFDVSGIQFRIRFDPQILRALTVDTAGTRVSGIYTDFPTAIDNDSGCVRWSGINFYDPHENYVTPGSGPIVYVFFEVDTSAQAGQQTQIELEDDPPTYMNVLSDRLGNIVFPALHDGLFQLLPVTVDTLKVVDSFGHPGDTVAVPMWMANSFDVSAIQFRIRFDPEILHALTVDTADTRVSGIYTHFPTQIDNDSGIVCWSGFNLDPHNHYVAPGTGMAAYVVFEVDTNVAFGAETPIWFEDDSVHTYVNNLSDNMGNMIIPFLDDGVFQSLIDTLRVVDSSGCPGDTVAVSIWLANSFDVSGIQFKIEYDPEYLCALRVDTAMTRVSGIYDHFPTLIDTSEGHVAWYGLNLSDPYNNYIPSGSGPVAHVVFRVKSGQVTETPIVFEDGLTLLSTRTGKMIIPVLNDGTFELLMTQTEDRVEFRIGFPRDLTVDRIFPNPFAQTTSVLYGIPSGSENCRITLQVYDSNGRLVRRLLDKPSHMSGWHTIQWNGRNDRGNRVPNGVYFCRMEADGDIVGIQKLILLK